MNMYSIQNKKERKREIRERILYFTLKHCCCC